MREIFGELIMTRLTYAFSTVVLVISQLGCSRNLSNAEPYRPLVGKDITLQRDMELRRTLNNRLALQELYPPGSTSTQSAPYGMLPKSTMVHVNSVKSVWALTTRNLVVSGHVRRSRDRNGG